MQGFFFTSDYFNCEKHLRGFYFYLLSHFSRAAVNLTTTFTCFSVDSNTAFYQDLHDWHRHTPVQASSFWLASGFFFSFLEIPVNNDFFSTAAHWQILLYKLDLEFDGKSVKVNIWNRFCHTRHLKLFISKSTKGFLTGLFFLNQQPKTNKSIVSRQDSVTEKREGFYFGCTVTDRFSYNDSGCLKAALWIC